MKYLALALALTLLLCGCSLRDAAAKLDAAEETIEQKAEQAEERIEAAVAPEASGSGRELISPETAQNTALTHAGLTADAVTGLRAEFENDDGVAHYDVQFYADGTEYEYEINAKDGTVLSFEKEKEYG